MYPSLNPAVLKRQNAVFRGTGGRSEENAERGFRPAFLDRDTRTVYPSRFADGRQAPMHLLDGLPDEVVLHREADGRVVHVKTSIVPGFLLDDRFYTREEAARHCQAVPAPAGRCS